MSKYSNGDCKVELRRLVKNKRLALNSKRDLLRNIVKKIQIDESLVGEMKSF